MSSNCYEMCVVTGACREEARGFMANDINKVAFLAFSLVFIRLTVSLGGENRNNECFVL
jgi:hypothetical protein